MIVELYLSIGGRGSSRGQPDKPYYHGEALNAGCYSVLLVYESCWLHFYYYCSNVVDDALYEETGTG